MMNNTYVTYFFLRKKNEITTITVILANNEKNPAELNLDNKFSILDIMLFRIQF